MKLKIVLLTNALALDDFRNMRIIRVISFLCRSNKDLKLLSTIAYDIIYSKTQNFHLLLMVISRICPELLKLPEGLNDVHPIQLAIMHLTKNEIINLDLKQKTSSTSDDHQFKFYLTLFERLCNWKSSFTKSSEIYSYLMPTIKPNIIFDSFDQFSSKAVEYLLSFQLMCKYEGWKWTIDVFIKQVVQDILVQENVDDNIVAFYIYLKANLVALLCPHEESQQAVEVMIKSLAILIKESSSSSIIQLKIIESLLLLAPRDPLLAFTEIQIWLKPNNFENNKKITQSLKSKIGNVYNMLKPKLPNYMIVNI